MKLDKRSYKNLGFFLGLVFLMWMILVLWITYHANRVGFDSKTLWDWLDLLIVPIVLVIGGLIFNWSQRKTELNIAEKNREEDRMLASERAILEKQIAAEREQINLLDKYFDQMSNLLLDFELRNSKHQDEVRIIARSRTLSVLLSLDGKRKGQLLHFLVEAKLVNFYKHGFPTITLNATDADKQDSPIVALNNADLSGAEIGEAIWVEKAFTEVNLSAAKMNKSRFLRITFHEANLRNAEMEECWFKECDLSSVDMKGAILKNAQLSQANLTSSNLSFANLNNANLSEANLTGYDPINGKIAVLRNANLQGANLENACLFSADLSGANLDGAILREAQYNELTIWPTGFEPVNAGAILCEGML